MFDPGPEPRVFGAPCGVDFGRFVVEGLRARLDGQPPEAIARTTLIVNTTRMRRRITEIFDAGPPGFLPRLELFSTLRVPGARDAGDVTGPLARRLELVELVRGLLARAPELAPASAAFDLAAGLASLMDELRDEGRDPSVLSELDVTDLSGHWQRAQRFLAIVAGFFEADATPDEAARRAAQIDRLIAYWDAHPPADPVILAGSTGSRGSARRLMQAIARLPQGAVILPGHDAEMPAHGWESLRATRGLQEDHPQYRHLAFCDALGRDPARLPMWHGTPAPSPERNALVSLALRPAPVTHVWRREGRDLAALDRATADLTLVEAQSRREEALAIALRLRQAAEVGQSAALISPDRILTRLATVHLDRWGIVPDESAGIPLQLTPPGRFLRHVAEVQTDRLTAEGLLVLLKHPLCHSGGGRNEHLRLTRDLELRLRSEGPPFPTQADLEAFAAEARATDAARRAAWVAWLGACLALAPDPAASLPLADRHAAHRAMSERLAAGSEAAGGTGGLWSQIPGAAARALMDEVAEAAPSGGAVDAREHLALFSAILASEQQTDRDAGDPLIRIWGTLEARVMGADLVILGGLDEGVWPQAPDPDPWLNRAMRKQAGLLLPERQIGLSAHDFQQAIGGREVWLTRALRNDGAETVPSRWLNRLCNLLAGLETGAPALAAMRDRGGDWLARARVFEAAQVVEVPRAPRPSPRPPVALRPDRLSVTQIRTLTRDPYAIHARHVLGLKPLDPLVRTADAAMRGTVMHAVFEAFVAGGEISREALLRCAETVLSRDVPWPDIRTLWQSRIARVADGFLEGEADRQAQGAPLALEASGRLDLSGIGFALTAKADRIDARHDGTLALFDYKTGDPPSAKQQKVFDKQLLLMAAMAEAGAFERVAAGAVSHAAYLGIGLEAKVVPAPLEEVSTAQTLAELRELISKMQEAGFGFTSRRAMTEDRFAGDYDHLARFGEWDSTDDPAPEDLT